MLRMVCSPFRFLSLSTRFVCFLGGFLIVLFVYRLENVASTHRENDLTFSRIDREYTNVL